MKIDNIPWVEDYLSDLETEPNLSTTMTKIHLVHNPRARPIFFDSRRLPSIAP
jgi:hypothetical protein